MIAKENERRLRKDIVYLICQREHEHKEAHALRESRTLQSVLGIDYNGEIAKAKEIDTRRQKREMIWKQKEKEIERFNQSIPGLVKKNERIEKKRSEGEEEEEEQNEEEAEEQMEDAELNETNAEQTESSDSAQKVISLPPLKNDSNDELEKLLKPKQPSEQPQEEGEEASLSHISDPVLFEWPVHEMMVESERWYFPPERTQRMIPNASHSLSSASSYSPSFSSAYSTSYSSSLSMSSSSSEKNHKEMFDENSLQPFINSFLFRNGAVDPTTESTPQMNDIIRY